MTFPQIFVRGLLLVFLAFPAHAATAQSVNLPRLAAQCGLGGCDTAVVAVVRRLQAQGMTDDDLNFELGLLAIELFDVAKTEEAAILERIARAIRSLSSFSTDPGQQTGFESIAQIVESGQAELFDISDPLSVSPS